MSELEDLGVLGISHRRRPIASSETIALAARPQEQGEELQKNIAERRVYQFRQYLDFLSQPDRMTPPWKRYGRKHLQEISEMLPLLLKS